MISLSTAARRSTRPFPPPTAAKLDDFQINEALLGSSGSIDLNTQVTSAAEKAQLRYAGGDLTNAATVEISGSNGQEVLFLGGSSSVQNIRDAVNNVTDSTGVTARVLDGASQSIARHPIHRDVGFRRSQCRRDIHRGSMPAPMRPWAEKSPCRSSIPGPPARVLGVNTTVQSNGDVNIVVNLATDGTSTITSTADDIQNLINNDATASQYVTAAEEGTGAGVVDAIAATDLTGAVDKGTLNFIDARPTGTAGTVNVVLADPGAASSPLGVSVSTSGNDSTITVNLATDGTGSDHLDPRRHRRRDPKRQHRERVDRRQRRPATEPRLPPRQASTALNQANGSVLAFESTNYRVPKIRGRQRAGWNLRHHRLRQHHRIPPRHRGGHRRDRQRASR